MTTKTISGSIETAYGKTLDTPLAYSGEATQYDSVQEAKDKDAGVWPSEKEVLKSVNADAVQSATASARKSALDAAGIKPPTAEDPDVAFKILVKTMLAQGKSQDVAEQLAKQMLS
jgi:hypothetical protein